jgi:hypothetical protein
VNDFNSSTQNAITLLQKGQQDAQLWHDLLSRSGGALEIKKCGFHLAHYSFTAIGAPVLDNLPLNAMTVPGGWYLL